MKGSGVLRPELPTRRHYDSRVLLRSTRDECGGVRVWGSSSNLSCLRRVSLRCRKTSGPNGLTNPCGGVGMRDSLPPPGAVLSCGYP
jgi:hypothetical protein